MKSATKAFNDRYYALPKGTDYNSDEELRRLNANKIRAEEQYNAMCTSKSKFPNVKRYVNLQTQIKKVEDGHIQMYMLFIPKLEAAIELERLNLENLAVKMQEPAIVRLPSPREILDPMVLKKMKFFIAKLARYFDSYQRIKLSLKAIDKTIKIYSFTPETSPVVISQHYHAIIDKEAPWLANVRRILAEDLSRILDKTPNPNPQIMSMGQVHELIEADSITDSNGRPIPNPYKASLWFFVSYPSVATFLTE